MSTAQNIYRADLREIFFCLFEQFRLGDQLGRAPWQDWGEDEVRMTITECYKFVCEVLGPLNSVGDAEGCTIVDGQVKTPTGFKEAWKKTYEMGWKSLSIDPEHGGQGAPYAVQVITEELFCGANAAFSMYPGLTLGASELVEVFGTPAQKKKYLEPMLVGQFAGTMCLTEPQAGSDVGAARSRAVPRGDGTYSITGTKIFISCGDHDLTENVIHLVLARVDGAAPGTKGLSLFIVPKVRVGDDGKLGERNDVAVGSIEHKMGINGSSTCVLNFGESNACIGELVGTVPHQGMAQMFRMMNGARLAVGLQGLGVASSAYLNALSYARDRLQGATIDRWKDPTAPRVSILQHADVRRMLIDMKSRVEGIRCLALKLAVHADRGKLGGPDAGYHLGQVELLTPLVKAYGSDQAFRVCETAIQTLGGAGYIKDYGIEQYCRDSKIFSIYEGTNHIQAMDLVGRKLAQAGGGNLMAFLADIARFAAQHAGHPTLAESVKVLARARDALQSTAMLMMGWASGGKLSLVPLAANRFLEMMSETVLTWLLLDGAVVAEEKARALPEGHPDAAFYAGKRATAIYYARNVAPGVMAKAEVLAAEEDSSLTIPDAGFATI
ncbi:MAG: acyl-CoA dehydrogenase [Myxococcales bacterium]|nr:acyl-CoA dehydrogenase [Myxococcales bacterium]